MEVKFRPDINVSIDKHNKRPVTRIWFYYNIEIERTYGRTTEKKWKVTRTVTYHNVSDSSKERLCHVIGKYVSNGVGKVALFYGGDIGMGFEAQF